jgi:hypothetical protein
MSEMFFYQERGKTVGPFSAEDMKTRIRDGRVRVFDLLYKDGEPTWKMALEHASLRAEFKTSTLATLKDRPWVCLQKKAKNSTEFTTTGPFTQEEISEALQTGKISYSDYAWKDSLAEWKRIGSLEEFNPRARSVVLPPVPAVPQESSVDLLKNVVEFQRPLPVNKVEDITFDADAGFTPPPVPVNSPAAGKSQDTTKYRVVTPSAQAQSPEPISEDTKTSSHVPSNTASIRIRAVSKGERANAEEEVEEPEGEDKKPHAWFDWGIVAVLVLVLIAVVLIVSRFVLPKASAPAVSEAANVTATPEPAAPAVPPPAPQVKFEPPPVAQVNSEPPPAPPAPPATHVPQQLILTVRTNSGAQPEIEVRTDGTHEYPVYLQIIGLPGHVAEGGSYYRFIRLKPIGKLSAPLELPSIKLPAGKYIVRAETTGDLHKETKFSWGVSEAQYKTAISKQRKQWAYALWKERLNLFILSQALEKQVTAALVPTKKFQAKKWNLLIALKRGEGSKYLMFDDWWELHNIAKEAKSGVNGALVSRAQKEREHLSGFTVWK